MAAPGTQAYMEKVAHRARKRGSKNQHLASGIQGLGTLMGTLKDIKDRNEYEASQLAESNFVRGAAGTPDYLNYIQNAPEGTSPQALNSALGVGWKMHNNRQEATARGHEEASGRTLREILSNSQNGSEAVAHALRSADLTPADSQKGYSALRELRIEAEAHKKQADEQLEMGFANGSVHPSDVPVASRQKVYSMLATAHGLDAAQSRFKQDLKRIKKRELEGVAMKRIDSAKSPGALSKLSSNIPPDIYPSVRDAISSKHDEFEAQWSQDKKSQEAIEKLWLQHEKPLDLPKGWEFMEPEQKKRWETERGKSRAELKRQITSRHARILGDKNPSLRGDEQMSAAYAQVSQGRYFGGNGIEGLIQDLGGTPQGEVVNEAIGMLQQQGVDLTPELLRQIVKKTLETPQ